jgi:hypothetical protein
LAVIAGYVLLLFLAAGIAGKSKVLSAAGAVQMSEHFADLSLFAAARQELDRGGDPYLNNPDDPWGRPFNYPKLWLSFMRFPPGWVPAMGFGLIIVWLAGTAAWCGRFTTKQGLLGGALVCSPPMVLAMERGNCDLIVFLLALLALAALHRGLRLSAWATVFLAFVLKLYPVAGFVIFLRQGWRTAWAWAVLSGAAVGCYIVLQRREISTVLHHTPADALMSFGATHWTKVANQSVLELTGKHYAFHHLDLHSMLWAALIFGASLWAGYKRRDGRDDGSGSDRFLDSFRFGACTYALTFIAGTSYVYRLVFLLLCVPWLWRKESPAGHNRRMRGLALTLIFGLLWINPYWWSPLALGSELSAWALLGVSGWLLGSTLPGTGASFRAPQIILKPSDSSSPMRKGALASTS